MKVHLISALLIVVTMNIHVSLTIWHGAEAEGNEFNWVVKIIGTLEPSTRKIHCTGSIISELHILTAAHCFEGVSPRKITVTAGIICKHDSCKSAGLHRVKEVHIHPSYGSDAVNIPRPDNTSQQLKLSDVALLTLETPLSFGEKIAAIPLPTEELDLSPGSSTCRMAGWGTDFTGNLTEHLLWTTMKMERSDRYKEFQRRYKLTLGKNPDIVTHTTGGDSGAGLMCEGVVTGLLLGSAAKVEKPTIFQSVYYFLDFINEIREKDAALLTTIRNVPKSKKFRPCICL